MEPKAPFGVRAETSGGKIAMERPDNTRHHLQLHFDFLSRKALLSVNGRGYVLPDRYPNKETAEVAAHKYAVEELGLGRSEQTGVAASGLSIWLH